MATAAIQAADRAQRPNAFEGSAFSAQGVSKRVSGKGVSGLRLLEGDSTGFWAFELRHCYGVKDLESSGFSGFRSLRLARASRSRV